MTRTRVLWFLAAGQLLGGPIVAQSISWPLAVPRVTQDYGCLDCFASGFHSGIDITDAEFACDQATVPVYPVLDAGRVVRTVSGCVSGDTSCSNGFGNQVIIEHRAPGDPEGPLYSLYAHLETVAAEVNDEPSLGTIIGSVGATGNVAGCHLHLALLDYTPPNLGSWTSPGNPLPFNGFFGYSPQPSWTDCDDSGSGKGCPDPKGFLPGEAIEIGGAASFGVWEAPDTGSPIIGGVESGQTFYSIASAGGGWFYIMMPSVLGPGEDPSSAHAVFGWTPVPVVAPSDGLLLKAGAELLEGIGLNVRDVPGGTVVSKLWGGHSYWGTGQTSPAGSGCSKAWYELHVPRERAEGLAFGWACSDFLVPSGGQCLEFGTQARSGLTSGGPSRASEGCASSVPSIVTVAASGITQNSVSLNMSVNPNGSDTTAWFNWGTSTAVTQTTSSANVGNGTLAQAFSRTLSGLSCGTTYYFRARAENPNGDAPPGAVLSFPTASCTCGGSTTSQLVTDPSFEQGDDDWWVTTQDFHIDRTPEFPNPRTGSYYAFLTDPDGFGSNNLLGGMLSPEMDIRADATAAVLRFWTRISTTETTSSIPFDTLEVRLVEPGNAQTLLATYSNLNSSGTSYVQRSINLNASWFGETVQIFFVGETDESYPTIFRLDDVTLEVTHPSGSDPTVDTDPADQVTSTSARLNMTVDPNNATTTVWFDFEPNDSTPTTDTEHVSVGCSSTAMQTSIGVSSLECGTTYYFRARASSSAGSDQGLVRSFVTGSCPAGPPTVITGAVGQNEAEPTTAILNSTVDPNGAATQAYFHWGTSPSYGQETGHFSLGSGNSPIEFPIQLQDLACDTTYHYRAFGTNGYGTRSGLDRSFSTPSCSLFANGFESGTACLWSASEGAEWNCGSPNSFSSSLDSTFSQSYAIIDANQQGLDIAGSLTLEFWAKIASDPGNYLLLGKYREIDAQQSYALQYYVEGGIKKIVFASSDNCSAEYNAVWSVDLGIGVWRHLALVFTAPAGSAELFLDGVTQGTRAEPPTSLCNSQAHFTIGQREGERHYDGQLDDIRVWAVARSGAEVNANRSVEIPCDSGGLVAYWKMNGNGQDCSANANHLAPDNVPTYVPDVPFE